MPTYRCQNLLAAVTCSPDLFRESDLNVYRSHVPYTDIRLLHFALLANPRVKFKPVISISNLNRHDSPWSIYIINIAVQNLSNPALNDQGATASLPDVRIYVSYRHLQANHFQKNGTSALNYCNFHLKSRVIQSHLTTTSSMYRWFFKAKKRGINEFFSIAIDAIDAGIMNPSVVTEPMQPWFTKGTRSRLAPILKQG